MSDKQAVRLAYKARRAALRAEDCKAWQSLLTQQIISLPEYEQATSLMLYLAMEKEANLDGVITHALGAGKTVYVPVCMNESLLQPARLRHLEEVDRGVLGIRVPKKPWHMETPNHIDLLLVPGLVFDRCGGRMGMGAGYYDRFLASVDTSRYMGVCWSMQVIDSLLPMDTYDCYMPKIITELGCIECNKNRKGGIFET